ncbi:putative ribonuclease H-like domain-containing protein [Tanacetum coccineum]|uniref:Ribonuclease H-like domain-containing protein n=1 Tax=Tanacetum coccineum TaxID=301880 RepID=A0ABQ5DWH9_9ASTR
MQKTILKQNYENFAASSQEGLDKTYDMFQSLSVNNEIHGQRLNATTAIGEVILLENAGHQGIRGIEIEMLQEGMHQEHQHKCLGYQDGIGGYDWSFQAEEGITNFALMAYTSQGSSSSNSEYDVQVKDISIQALQIIEEALKEKDDLKLKLEKFEESSKNLTKLIDSQLKSDVDDNPVNDRFKTGEGFHAVPPPYTRNYMPSRPDLSFAGLDDSVYKTKKKLILLGVTNVTTAGPKAVVSDAVRNGENVVKSSACWIWRPTGNIIDHNSKDNIYKRLMRGVISAFGGSPNGGKITGIVPTQQYILLPLLYDSPQSLKDAVADDAGKKTNEEPANEGERNGQEKEGGASNKEGDQNVQDFRAELDNLLVQQNQGYANSTNRVSTISPSVSAAWKSFTNPDDLPTDPLMPDLEGYCLSSKYWYFSGAYDDERRGLQRNKKDKRGIVVRNKARLVAQGYTQEEGIDYDEVFAPVARIEAIRLFLAYASFMGFIVYQMDVKSAFLYGTIEEEVYVCQPPSFEDPQFPDKVYKVEKALYGLHQALRAWTKRDDGIFISQDKYVADILKKFDFSSVKTTSTPIETNKALLKDEEAEDVDVHLYRSMIGSLMYLTASRPDIMFAVCACARFQVTPKVSHLYAVKRIFRYLKGQPKLGLWYPRDSPFDLEAFLDSDYAGASLDRKSTTGGCQFLGKRLISWQCKKQTVVANSTTEAEYVAAANCCGQVLWIQNQMLDYGFNFMNTKIYIDNESTICIVKNPVYHSKTKHIEIRHHFIRDSYEKRLIQVIKIHTYHNVADLLTKAFDVSSDELGVKTGSCKINAARQDLVLLGEMDFLTTSPIHYALNVSPTIYASYIEQFWATTKSKTVNDVKQIHDTVNGITVVISKFLESDLHFNDEDEQITTIASQSQKTHIPRRAKRDQDTEIPQSSSPPKKVGDEDVYTREDERLVRAATTATSLEAEQKSEGDFDDDFDDTNDMVNEKMDNVEGYTVNAGGAVNTATTGVSAANEDLTISQTFVKMRSEKAKEKRVAFRDVEESVRSTKILPTIDPKDKGKGIMKEPENPPKNTRKAQI